MSEPTAVEPPRPLPDDLTQFFWDGCNERRLLIQACNACGHYIHWPRPVCPRCTSTDLAPAEVSGRATLYAHTISDQAFHPYFVDKVPLILATVTLVEQDGLQFFTQLVDCTPEDLTMDLPLRVAFTEVAPDLVLPFFAPAEA